MRVVIAALFALTLASACGSTKVTGGPRPPQGPGPAGTQFGFWARDAEGSVDGAFRSYISRTYDVGEETKARAALERDGFRCQDANRPDGRPVPQLECVRLYQLEEDVHAWTVKFWPNQREPESHYTRTHVRDPMKLYDDKR